MDLNRLNMRILAFLSCLVELWADESGVVVTVAEPLSEVLRLPKLRMKRKLQLA